MKNEKGFNEVNQFFVKTQNAPAKIIIDLEKQQPTID